MRSKLEGERRSQREPRTRGGRTPESWELAVVKRGGDGRDLKKYDNRASPLLRWDGGTEEHWPEVPKGMKEFGGTQTPPRGTPTPCKVHPTW
jgi:hypothetical protein